MSVFAALVNRMLMFEFWWLCGRRDVSQQMLTEGKVGEIRSAYRILKNVSAVAKLLSVDPKTVSKYKAADFKHRPAKQRQRSHAIKQRIEVVKKLAQTTCSKEGRKFPKFGSASEIRAGLKQKTGVVVSVRQTLRYLKAAGLRSYVRPTSTTRKACEIRRKKDFARRMRTLPPGKLRSIVFSDETWLSCMERSSRMQWCRCRRDALPRERKARWNIPSCLVWGAVGIGYKGPLIIFPSKMKDTDGDARVFRLDSRKYINKCLAKVVPDMLRLKRWWQQDGARAHASKMTYAYLARKKVSWIEDWPAYAAEWNAIERIWNELSNRIGRRCPMSLEELIAVAQEEWNKMPQSLIDQHCRHFAKQMREYK